jgi:Tol biopolymer transport system component
VSTRGRLLLITLVSVALVATAIIYIGASAHRRSGVGGQQVSVAPSDRLLVRSTAKNSFGRLATVDRSDPQGPRLVSDVSCNRVYAVGGTAMCLRPDGPLATYQLAIFDRDLSERDTYPLVGVPNRARVSPSGHILAWTAFVTGDSYNGGRFSTRVGMLNLLNGDEVGTLETFAVTRDGVPYRAVDENFWGVTFVDDNRFYATMSSGGHRYLVAGDVGTRTARVVATNVECPSLSPDRTRLVFKSAIGDDPAKGWRLSVLDLATMRRTALAETRSVDDQAAWFDDKRVMYAVGRGADRSDVWSVPADGSGAPRLLVPDAESPAPLWRS